MTSLRSHLVLQRRASALRRLLNYGIDNDIQVRIDDCPAVSEEVQLSNFFIEDLAQKACRPAGAEDGEDEAATQDEQEGAKTDAVDKKKFLPNGLEAVGAWTKIGAI